MHHSLGLTCRSSSGRVGAPVGQRSPEAAALHLLIHEATLQAKTEPALTDVSILRTISADHEREDKDEDCVRVRID